MKLMYDKLTKLSTLVVEEHKPTLEQFEIITQFVQDTLKSPEPIVGVYYRDIDNDMHMLELKQQCMFVMLLTLQQYSGENNVHIVFENSIMPVKIPNWLTRFLRFVKIIPTGDTYKDFIGAAYANAGKDVSESFSGKS